MPFYPYFLVKDILGFLCLLLLLSYLVFFEPNALGHPDNYIRADPLVTPPHIVPEWYFLPFYAILRAVPSKLGGVVAMGSSICILFLLPTLDSGSSGVKHCWFLLGGMAQLARHSYLWFEEGFVDYAVLFYEKDLEEEEYSAKQ